jgi:hypothetical protein
VIESRSFEARPPIVKSKSMIQIDGVEHPAHSLLSGIKLRQHGFADRLDTEDAIIEWMERMQREKVLPG